MASNPYMSGGRTNVYRNSIGSGAGRNARTTSEPSGKASQPRGGRVAIRSSGTSAMSVSSGSSGKALKVSAKQK